MQHNMEWLLAEFVLLLYAAFGSCESCDHQLHQCSEGQICSAGKCECLKGACASEERGAGYVATVAVLALAAAALMAAGLVLIARRYRLLELLRQRLEARRNRDVLYEDVMIGQDDPPLVL